MAGYPKIWTTILHEDWFVELSCTQRGVVLQLFLLAKQNGDTGRLTYTGWSHLAHELRCDRATLVRLMGKNPINLRIPCTVGVGGILHVKIAKYREYQDLTCSSLVEKSTQVEHPSRAEQSRAEQSMSDKPTLPSVDRFREWWKGNETKIHEICTLNSWDYKDVWGQGPVMATWITTNPQKGNKKNWAAFVANWMRRYYNRPKGAMMTAAEEEAHYAGHRRSDSDGPMKSIGDILSEIKETE